MSLDKQRILNELGSVMNQLQSADCGCMGKLFNPGHGSCNPTGNPLPTCGGCRRGCCPGHGYGVHYNNGGGDPYTMNSSGMHGGGMHGGGMHGGGMHSGGMHGGGMPGGGMPGGGMHGGGMPGGGMHGGGMHGGGMHGGGMHGSGMHGGPMMDYGTEETHGGDMNSGGMLGMSGGMPGGLACSMGRHAPKLYADTYNYLSKNLMQPVVKEVYDDLRTITPQNTIGNNPLATKMGLPVSGSASPTVQGNAGAMGGQIPVGNLGQPGMGSVSPNVTGGQISAGGMGGGQDPSAQMGGMGAQIANMMTSGGGGRPVSRPNAGQAGQGAHLTEPMLIDAPHSPHGQIGVTPLSPVGANPTSGMQQPITQYVTQDQVYSATAPPQGNTVPPGNQHAMPGSANPVMPQMGGGGANPYGHHTASINKFKEMFPGAVKEDINFDPMAIAIQMNPANQKAAAMDTMTKLMNGNKGMGMTQPGANATVNQPGAGLANQQITNPASAMPPQQQQVYAAAGAPSLNQGLPQQVPQQQIQGQEFQQGQQLIDPNTGAVVTADQGRAPADPAVMNQEALQEGQDTREPIYPVDNSKGHTVGYALPQYTYNTLGQPVEMLPQNAYQRYEPSGLQQTLFGGPGRGYGVKNTMSKTSLAGNRVVGTKASRSQLQHIYRQYKASQSATQQNIRPPPPVQGGSVSEGQLHTSAHPANINPPGQQIPLEKVGGDTFANNPNVQMAKVEQGKLPQVSEVPAASNAPHGDHLVEKAPVAEVRKGRNGLQDQTFTRYQATGAWSFHG